MEASYQLVLGFSAWTLFLLLLIGLLRVGLVLTGHRKPNGFKPSGEDVSPFANRLCRAHANCYENMPMVLGVILYAAWTNQLAVTNCCAMVFLGARVLQSLTHIISTRNKAVLLRFAFFAVQCAILAYWMICLWF